MSLLPINWSLIPIVSPASLVAHMVKSLPEVQETQVASLGGEDPLEKEMATHSSILAWKISWTEEPGGLQSMGSQRVRCNWVANTYLLSYTYMGGNAMFWSVIKKHDLETLWGKEQSGKIRLFTLVLNYHKSTYQRFGTLAALLFLTTYDRGLVIFWQYLFL